MPLSEKLLSILVCPKTHEPLEYDQAGERLISRAAGLAYPVVNNVPVLLVDEADEI